MENRRDLLDQQTPASITRFLVVAVTISAAFLLYLHRFCMSYAQLYIKEDLDLTDRHLSWCFSAFFLSYALGQVPSGWMSDRFGARRMLTLYILVWSFFTATMGLATGLVMLLGVRLAAGLGQAGAYPTSAGLLSKWVPFSIRGVASSWVAFGGRLGGGMAPLLTAYLIVALVPLGVSPEMTRDDLLDARYLCQRLQSSADDSPALQRVLARFSPADREAIGPLAKQYQQGQQSRFDRLSSAQRKKYEFKAYDDQVRRELAPADSAAETILIERLNGIISWDEFYRPVDFEKISPEKEADRFIARGVDSLSSQERQRLNRLLLEALFPKSVKKLYGRGWRGVMWIFGSLGILVAGLFWLVMRDTPAKHPWCNKAEVILIQKGRPPAATKSQGKVHAAPLGRMLTSRSLWLMCVTQVGSNIGWVFLVTWLPKYLLEVHRVSLIQGGWMASIPLWIGWVGMLSGGPLTDWVTARLGLRWGRGLPIACGRFLAMSAYIACLFLDSPWMLVAAFAVVAFSTDMCGGSIWAYKQDVGGVYVGSIHGWANMWGNLGATISPILLYTIVRQYNSWDAAFVVCAIAFGVAGLAALGIDASRPVAPPPE